MKKFTFCEILPNVAMGRVFFCRSLIWGGRDTALVLAGEKGLAEMLAKEGVLGGEGGLAEERRRSCSPAVLLAFRPLTREFSVWNCAISIL